MKKQPAGNRWARTSGVALLVLVLPVPLWVLAHRLTSRSAQPPPFADEAMPVVPPPDTNGFDDVVLLSSERPPSDESPIRSLTLPLEDETPASRWRAIERQSPAVRAFVEEFGDAAYVDSVLGQPRFADSCVDWLGDCRIVRVVAFVRHAIALNLVAMLDENWPTALRRAAQLVHATLDALSTARSLISHRAAMIVAQLAMDHARVLNEAWPHPDAPEPGNDMIWMLRAIQMPRRRDVHVRRAIVVESLHVRESVAYLREASRADARRAADGESLLRSLRSKWAIDEQATIAESDAFYVALMRWARDPHRADGDAPVRPRYATGFGWWLWNPSGKLMLDALGSDAEVRVIRSFDESAERLFRSHDALLRELPE